MAVSGRFPVNCNVSLDNLSGDGIYASYGGNYCDSSLELA